MAYTKILRKYPEIQHCVVSIARHIDQMAENNGLTLRRSARLLQMKIKEDSKQKPLVTKKVGTPIRKKATRNRKTIVPSLVPKSILIGNRLRERSKSVSFDPKILSPEPNAAASATISRRVSVDKVRSGSSGQTTPTNSTSYRFKTTSQRQQNGNELDVASFIKNAFDENIGERRSADGGDSGEILDYKNRIWQKRAESMCLRKSVAIL